MSGLVTQLFATAQQIEDSGIGTSIAESRYLFLVIEGIHLIGLSVAAGLIALTDLRLMGLILRRVPVAKAAEVGPKVLHLGPVRYELERGELWRGAEQIRLTATEAALMRIFAVKPGEAVSREQLVADLGRDDGQATARAVDVQITRLRRKIEADSKQPRYLQTVRGAGYMLAPD